MKWLMGGLVVLAIKQQPVTELSRGKEGQDLVNILH